MISSFLFYNSALSNLLRESLCSSFISTFHEYFFMRIRFCCIGIIVCLIAISSIALGDNILSRIIHLLSTSTSLILLVKIIARFLMLPVAGILLDNASTGVVAVLYAFCSRLMSTLSHFLAVVTFHLTDQSSCFSHSFVS